MASTECAQSDGSDDDNKPVHVITKEDIARIMAEPPPPGSHIVISPLGDESVQGYPGDVEPRSHGVHEIRDVVEILEGVEISCCMISEPALIYYGTGRLMMVRVASQHKKLRVLANIYLGLAHVHTN